MFFVVKAQDHPNVLSKRMTARPDHVALSEQMKKEGKLLFAGAVTDENDQMIASVMVCAFDDRRALDDWLKIEPYMTQKVWNTITIEPIRIGPSFSHLIPAAV